MTCVHLADGPAVTLSPRDFVAKGGEGSVYAREGRAYKLYHDPARALSPARLAALSALDHARVLRPEALLYDEDGAPIGFVAAYVADTEPLGRFFARSFRDQRGVTDDDLLALLLAMVEVLDHAHDREVHVVDLNPNNVLVGPDLRTPWFIDVDSWQCPGFPATAIMDSVRDRHAPPNTFGAATDWFAFAVVAFQLLVGVHPYRGGHPVKGLDARMSQNISVLRPEVVLPPSCEPVGRLPAPLRDWFHAVLEEGARCAPPRLALLCAVAPPSAPLAAQAPSPYPAMVRLEGGRLVLTDPETLAPIPLTLAASAFAWHAGTLYAHAGDAIVEVTLRRLGGRTLATTRVASAVLPLATRLYPGVALQDALGAVWASLFVAPGRCHQLRVPHLDGRVVVDATLDRRALHLLVAHPSGRHDRVTLRLDRTFTRYDPTREKDVDPSRWVPRA